jgi:glucosamine-6-phosphate deaminase
VSEKPPLRPAVRLVRDPGAAALLVADEIAELARDARRAGRPLVLGLATGRTPVAVYAELVRRARAGAQDLAGAIAFNLDEYCGLAPGDPRSFAAWMERALFAPLAWPRERRHIPDGSLPAAERERHCAEYEARIRAAGGLDLQLLGIGRNGHVGFNEPGSARDSRTRCVELHPDTRADAAREFGPGAAPREALTMGVATILEARRVRLLAFGAHKRAAVERALRGPPGDDCPASFLAAHPDARLYADAAALGAVQS